MIRKKVCLVGASAVGKTSLVERFVRGTFSDIYRTTIGVKIDRKLLQVGDRDLDLILWDLEGEDAFAQVQDDYLRGASGMVVVADGTRAGTLDTALSLQARAAEINGARPCVLAINKLDLFEQWEVSDRDVVRLLERGFQVERLSARTGAGVSEAFGTLGRTLLEPVTDARGSPVP